MCLILKKNFETEDRKKTPRQYIDTGSYNIHDLKTTPKDYI
jgi:hypothetical protein